MKAAKVLGRFKPRRRAGRRADWAGRSRYCPACAARKWQVDRGVAPPAPPGSGGSIAVLPCPSPAGSGGSIAVLPRLRRADLASRSRDCLPCTGRMRRLDRGMDLPCIRRIGRVDRGVALPCARRIWRVDGDIDLPCVGRKWRVDRGAACPASNGFVGLIVASRGVRCCQDAGRTCRAGRGIA